MKRSKYVPNDKSPRAHSEVNQSAIYKSLENLGAGRAILTDKKGKIIAGNEVFKQAEKLNMPIQEITTDGKRLVVIRRKDLTAGDMKSMAMMIADNKTSDLSSFDSKEVAVVLDTLPEDMKLATGFTEEEQKLFNKKEPVPTESSGCEIPLENVVEEPKEKDADAGSESEKQTEQKKEEAPDFSSKNKEIDTENVFKGSKVVCCPFCGSKFELKAEEKK